MRQIYEHDIIASLGNISGMHKLLYITLWSRADAVGVVHVNLDQILGMTGIRYQMEDFTHFGNRLVHLNDSEVLLTRFLQTTVVTLSTTNRGLKDVWRAIEMRWKATKDNLQPLIDAWTEMKIGIFLPAMPSGYISEKNPGSLVLKHREELLLAQTYETPYGWSQKLAEAFNDYRDHMVKIAWGKTTKSDIDKFRILPSNVKTLQEIVQEMLSEGYSEKTVIQQIRYSKSNHKLLIYKPNAKPKND